ncbi:MAG: helix-turn-helix domain-containing protein [Nitrosomonas sp.]|nr:helix-turn-helix domain-containing protein [Nitrosomonas sp.]
MKKEHNHFLLTACNLLGGQRALANKLNVSSPTVNQWIKGVRPIPAKQCPEIEKLVSGKVKCEDLRPDVDWAYLRGTGSEEAA